MLGTMLYSPFCLKCFFAQNFCPIDNKDWALLIYTKKSHSEFIKHKSKTEKHNSAIFGKLNMEQIII
jgi:hypothetical protein